MMPISANQSVSIEVESNVLRKAAILCCLHDNDLSGTKTIKLEREKKDIERLSERRGFRVFHCGEDNCAKLTFSVISE
jgi:hypothetical protein